MNWCEQYLSVDQGQDFLYIPVNNLNSELRTSKNCDDEFNKHRSHDERMET